MSQITHCYSYISRSSQDPRSCKATIYKGTRERYILSLHFAKMRLIASVCVLGLLVFALGQGESKQVQLPEEDKAAVKDDEEAKPDAELAKIPDIAKSYWSHCEYIF